METALVGLIGLLIGSGITYLIHREGLGVKMVEIAVELLAAKPDPGNKALRDWAVNILAHYSPKGVPFSPEAKEELRDKPLPIVADKIFSPTGRSYRPRGLGAVGESGEIFEVPMPPPREE